MPHDLTEKINEPHFLVWFSAQTQQKCPTYLLLVYFEWVTNTIEYIFWYPQQNATNNLIPTSTSVPCKSCPSHPNDLWDGSYMAVVLLFL